MEKRAHRPEFGYVTGVKPEKRLVRFLLFDLLFQILEKRGAEKVDNIKLQAVADLFDGGNRGGIVPSADDIVQRGLCYPTQRG